MATPTYTLLYETTTTSTTSSITISSLPQTYRDLVVTVFSPPATGGIRLRLNGDSGSNYDNLQTYHSTFSNWTSQFTTGTNINPLTTVDIIQWEIIDYSATDKYKNVIARADHYGGATATFTGPNLNIHSWESTAAVTSVEVSENTIPIGTIITVHGIEA